MNEAPIFATTFFHVIVLSNVKPVVLNLSLLKYEKIIKIMILIVGFSSTLEKML